MKTQITLVLVLFSTVLSFGQWDQWSGFSSKRLSARPAILKGDRAKLLFEHDLPGTETIRYTGIGWGLENANAPGLDEHDIDAEIMYDIFSDRWLFNDDSGQPVVIIDHDNETPNDYQDGAMMIGAGEKLANGIGVLKDYIGFDEDDIQAWSGDGTTGAPSILKLQPYGGGVMIDEDGTQNVANYGTGSLIIGDNSGRYIGFDKDDIQAYADGGEGTLFINDYGGDVRIGGLDVGYIFFDAETQNVGIGTQTPMFRFDVMGNGNFTGELTASSDARLKKNVKDIENATATLAALRPVSYQFRAEDYPELALSTGHRFGLIAQEVENILHELVVHKMKAETINGEETFFKSVNYIDMISILIKANQEQEEQILQLKAANNSIQARVEKLEKLISL